MLGKTDHNYQQHNSQMYKCKHSKLLTYESAGEDLVISGAQLTSQVVGGDSPRSSCFLSVVHLYKEKKTHLLTEKTKFNSGYKL